MPWVVADWQRRHPDTEMTNQQVGATDAGITKGRPPRSRDPYQYRADRARRTLYGIEAQVTEAQQAIAGKTAIKRNRFVQITGAT